MIKVVAALIEKEEKYLNQHKIKDELIIIIKEGVI